MSQPAKKTNHTVSPLAKAAITDIPDLLNQLETRDEGLNDHEVSQKLKTFGPNSLSNHNHQSPLIEFLKNFTNPLVLMLVVIAIVSFLMGNNIDGSLICVMVFMSVVLNFMQEFKASKAAEALEAKVAHIVDVYRNTRLVEIQAARLVPGDVIELNAGDLIPADARIIEAKDFFVDQAALTGESFPIEKNDQTMAIAPHDLSEMQNITFSGTGVHTGWARAVVVMTGVNSEFGKLAGSIQEVAGDDEFSLALSQFSKMIIKLIVVLCIFIFGVKAVIHHEFWESLEFAVVVAVGLTPEFLPMIMSVTMGKGSVRMALKGVIVKRLTAIPTIGSMDILCTDKTGTLTANKIALVKYVDIFGETSEPTLKYSFLNSTFQSGITNPMDDAVRMFGHISSDGFTKVDEMPFDFERKRLTIVVAHGQSGTMITKGAPESMLPVVDSFWYQNKPHPFTADAKKRFMDLFTSMSKEGYRVLAVATKPADPNRHPFTKTDESKMTFSGFIAFLDPAKKGVRQALDELELLGIEVKIVSGDNELVTQKICKDVDIVVKGILLGSEIDDLSDEKLSRKIENTTIFARFNPEQKNRVIRLLREKGHVVGYMGDGINDAPSLMTADVGISVNNAVEVAREAADLVLTHKSLHELAEGVKEGRKTFGNTMKYIMMGLSSNFGNMFSMLGAVIFLPFLPMLPLQILLNNFIYDLSQVTIPTDSVDEEYIQHPKRMRIADIRKFMFLFGPISSLFDFITFGILFAIYAHSPAQFQTGWFLESLGTQTLVIHIIRTRLIPFIESKASVALTVTTVGGIILGWFIALTKIGSLFGFQPVSFMVLVLIMIIVMVYLGLTEFGKRYYYRHLVTETSLMQT